MPRNDLLEHQTEILAFLAVKFDLEHFPARPADIEYKFRLTRGLESKIEIIAYAPAVYLNDPVARLKFQLVAEAVRRDFGDRHARPAKLGDSWCYCKFVHRGKLFSVDFPRKGWQALPTLPR